MKNWQYHAARDGDVEFKERFRSVKREATLVSVLVSLPWWLLVRAYLKLVHRFRVTGRERLPEVPRFFLVANHASHLDALALMSTLPLRWNGRVYAVAAGDTFFESGGATVFASQCLNALPLWRGKICRHALDELRDRIEVEENVLVLFPEGTRSRDGSLGEFKTGIGLIVAGTPIPVVPCYISGAHEAWPPDGKFPRPRPLRVTIGEPVSFENTPNRREGWEAVSRQLQEAVKRLEDRASSPPRSHE